MTKPGRPRKERYARLMGGFWKNRKIRRLSLEARGLLATAWSYCASEMTDGSVPLEFLEMWGGKRWPAIRSELTKGTAEPGDRPFLSIEVGEIDAVVHGWTDVNITAAEWEAKLESDRSRKRQAGGNPTGNGQEFPGGNTPDIPTGNPDDFQTAAQTKTKTKTLSEREEHTPASADVVAVFDHWRAAFGKTEQTHLSPKRRKRIAWAIERYGAETARRAIDGYSKSSFHRAGGHTDVELFFRDEAKVERGLHFAEHGDTGNGKSGAPVMRAPSKIDPVAAKASQAKALALFGAPEDEVAEVVNG